MSIRMPVVDFLLSSIELCYFRMVKSLMRDMEHLEIGNLHGTMIMRDNREVSDSP